MGKIDFCKSNNVYILKTGLLLVMIASLLHAGSLQAAENIKRSQDTSAKSDHKHNKVNNLSKYITKIYKVSPTKAILIVKEAMDKSMKNGLELELVLAVIAVESTFREKAVSRVGARGLMQIMPKWHPIKINAIGGIRALFDPAKNIHVGTQILKEYLARSNGNLRRALLRYNGSLGKRSSYADKVMRKYHRFKQVA